MMFDGTNDNNHDCDIPSSTAVLSFIQEGREGNESEGKNGRVVLEEEALSPYELKIPEFIYVCYENGKIITKSSALVLAISPYPAYSKPFEDKTIFYLYFSSNEIRCMLVPI